MDGQVSPMLSDERGGADAMVAQEYESYWNAYHLSDECPERELWFGHFRFLLRRLGWRHRSYRINLALSLVGTKCEVARCPSYGRYSVKSGSETCILKARK
jgi:hypothetical protein